MRFQLALIYLLHRALGGTASDGAAASYWQPVASSAGTQRYFREDDPADPPPSLALRWLLRLSRRFAPQPQGKTGEAARPTDAVIPDEIYTLW